MGERAYGAKLLESGSTDEQSIAAVVASSEYFRMVNPSVAIATTKIVHGTTINTTLSRWAKLTLTVLHIVPTGRAVDGAVTKPHTKLVGVVSFGRHHKGRVRLHWNRRVRGKRLKRGRYVLILKAITGSKLIGVSDALPLLVR